LTLDNSITVTDNLYQSVDDNISIDFQWATSSISPSFAAAGGMINDTSSSGGSFSMSTLTLKGAKYNQYSVQIAQATHKGWILPVSSQTNNQEDIIIIFSSDDSSAEYTYIILVIPILRDGTTTSDPSYLTALNSGDSAAISTPISLSSCLPKNPNSVFANYASCIDGYTGHQSSQNIYVFVSTEGIHVSESRMNFLAGTGRSRFQGVTLPFTTNTNTASAKPIDNATFSKYVLTTNELLNYRSRISYAKGLEDSSRTDPQDSYKCVPLDPDKDIQNGQINIDVNSGRILSEVLAERAAVRSASEGTPSLGKGTNRVQKYISSALGILCAVIIFGLLLTFLIPGLYTGGSMFVALVQSTQAARASAAATATATATDFTSTGSTSSWLQQLPVYGIMIIVSLLLGFTGGAMLT